MMITFNWCSRLVLGGARPFFRLSFPLTTEKPRPHFEFLGGAFPITHPNTTTCMASHRPNKETTSIFLVVSLERSMVSFDKNKIAPFCHLCVSLYVQVYSVWKWKGNEKKGKKQTEEVVSS